MLCKALEPSLQRGSDRMKSIIRKCPASRSVYICSGLSKESVSYRACRWRVGELARSSAPAFPDAEPALVASTRRRQLHAGHGHGRRPVVLRRFLSGGFPVVGRDERHGVGMFREHVHRPFAAPFHMLFRQSPVVVERALDNRVGPALQLVRGRRQRFSVPRDGGSQNANSIPARLSRTSRK